jgi:hypothetical protein
MRCSYRASVSIHAPSKISDRLAIDLFDSLENVTSFPFLLIESGGIPDGQVKSLCPELVSQFPWIKG